MKNVNRNSAWKCYALLLLVTMLITTKSVAQNFSISLDEAKQAKERTSDKIYPVTYKEIEYRAIEDGEVMTNSYKIISENLNKYQKDYDKYVNKITSNAEKHEAIKIINSNIDAFLNSNDKYDIKEKYLIESQALADKCKLEVVFFDYDRTVNIVILLYDKNKKTKKDDIKTYQQFITNLKIIEPEKSWECSEYIRIASKLANTQKTEAGKVLSDKISKRFVYIVDLNNPVDILEITGNFTKLLDDYILVNADVDGLFVKNELTTDLRNEFNGGDEKRYHVIQNVNTKQYYYIMSDNFLSIIERIKNEQEMLSIIHKLGYSEYKQDGELYIKSKTAEIKLDTWMYSELKLNSAYISTFDNDQIKISTLTKQTIPHSKILDRYVNLYNIQRSRMSSTDINAWRTATANAIKLNEQIYKLNKKYEGNYSFKLFDESNTFEIFSNNIRASKVVLGM